MYTDATCYLGSPCTVAMSSANPSSKNVVLIVKSSGYRSTCGDACEASGIAGGTGADFVQWARPVGALTDIELDFGTPMGGLPSLQGDPPPPGALTDGSGGVYNLCWGPEILPGSTSAAVTSWASAVANCSVVPITVGRLTVKRSIDPDPDGERTESQCVKGAACSITVKGYDLPDGTSISTPPESDQASGVRCAASATNKYLGYQEYVDKNPGISWTYSRPVQAAGNLTTWLTVDFGRSIGLGQQLLCACLKRSCGAPNDFNMPAGYMRVRSSKGNEKYVCLEGSTCQLTVTGVYLQVSDRIAIVKYDESCFSDVDLAKTDWPFGEA